MPDHPVLRTFPAREYDPGKWYPRYGEPVLLGTPTQVPEEDPRFVFLEDGEEPPKSQSALEFESRLAAKLNQSAGTQSTLSAVAPVFSELWDESNSQFAAEDARWQERRSFQHITSGSDSERSESPNFYSDLEFTKGGGKRK